MSDIERFVTIWGGGGMMPASSGDWVRYDDHRAEFERLTARQTEMETHITGLTTELHRTRADGIELRWVAGEVEQLTAQRDAAQAEVERLKEQVGALTVAVEQADEMKAHAEAAAAAEEAETDRVVADGNKALAEVERLTVELHETRKKLTRVQVQYDEFAKVTAKVIDQHQRERDHARQQVYRLQQAGADRPTDQSAQNLDMANGQAILDSSRPSDEDIWREVFFRCVSEYITGEKRVIIADTMLAEYRRRWPR